MSCIYRLALILIAMASSARAEVLKSVVLSHPIDVRRTPDLSAPVVLRLGSGERVFVSGDQNGIARVRFRRAEGWRSGYVESDRLNATGDARSAEWLVGGTLALSALSQGARSFQTQDEVRWTTSTYASQTIWPAFFVQWRHRNFWRFSFGARRVDFNGHAVADVAQTTRDVEVTQNMISGRLERAWHLIEPIYVSVGAEVARALSMTAKLGGVQLPTTSEDIKVYAGGSLGVGAGFPVGRRLGGFVEARAGVYPTLSPVAMVFEAAAGAGYWF